MNSKRGAFIVFEGCDRSGKSTQSKKLAEYLNEKSIPTILMNFPNRTTAIGQVINEYLLGNKNLNNQVIHLLFSANRWELEKEIRAQLLSGTTIICDRYSFSGVAYTAAKEGMDFEWCKYPEIGLPKPDLVLFLNLSENCQKQRPGFGDEVYEKPIFQQRVLSMFEKLKDDTYWETINVENSIEQVHKQIVKITTDRLSKIQNKLITELW